MHFEQQEFIVNFIDRAGIPKPFASDEERRYFPKRSFHGIILHTNTEAPGFYRIISEGKEHIVKYGQILFLPKGIEYETLPFFRSDTPSCFFINFDTTNKIEACSMVHSVKNMASYKKLFSLAVDAQQGVLIGTPGTKEQQMSLLYTILSELKSELISDGKAYAGRRKIAPAIDFILAHPEDNRNVTALAAMCGLKPPFFRKCFKQATDVSPIVFRNNAKIAMAQRLIEQTSLKLPEIATACGIDDYYYFCRLFKKTTGVTPGNYYKKALNIY